MAVVCIHSRPKKPSEVHCIPTHPTVPHPRYAHNENTRMRVLTAVVAAVKHLLWFIVWFMVYRCQRLAFVHSCRLESFRGKSKSLSNMECNGFIFLIACFSHAIALIAQYTCLFVMPDVPTHSLLVLSAFLEFQECVIPTCNCSRLIPVCINDYWRWRAIDSIGLSMSTF